MEGRKGQAALEHFKRAAEKNTNSGQVLEMLGELLATTDPQGDPYCFLECSHERSYQESLHFVSMLDLQAVSVRTNPHIHGSD